MNEPMPAAQVDTSKRRTSVIIASIIGVVVLLALGAYVFTKLPIAEQVSALMLPKELQGARFISSSPQGTVVYEHTGNTYQPRMRFEGSVDSVVATIDGYAGIKRSVDGARVQIVHQQDIVTEHASVRSLNASPDGRRVAYVETKDGTPYASDPAGWTVKVYYPDPGTTQTVGAGFAPFFLSNTALAWFTTLGAYQMDLERGTISSLLTERFTQPFEEVMVSPNHMVVARKAADRSVRVYRIEGTSMTLVDTYTIAGAGSYALGNDALYGIKGTEGGSEIWRQGFDGSLRRLTVMPPTLGVTGLILMSE